MGAIVICSSFLSVFINIPCHAGLIWGEDNHAVIQARERYLERVERARLRQLEVSAAGGAPTVDTDGVGQDQDSDNIKDQGEDNVEDPESAISTTHYEKDSPGSEEGQRKLEEDDNAGAGKDQYANTLPAGE